ncbi:MAG: phosphate/phosphite/phosphonate ABC transporter substrate-binding protein [Pontimonas sp.]|nr:phosphate/phosphite/phosphonate ABC transporter substrate-binding protein [Pontimonas sp.]
MSSSQKFGALAAGSALALVLAGCSAAEEAEAPAPTESAATDERADWPETLVFGAVPSEESSSLVESYEKIIEVLEQELGIEVEFVQATDYAGVIEGQVSGRVHLAQYGPFSYVLADIRGAELEVAGVMTDGPDIEPGYQAYGIALASNGDVNAIEDFAGKTVCFVDPASTSGFLYPSEGLLSAGIDPEADVTPVFAGGHDASVLAVKNGDCEAGFAFDAMVDKNLIESGDIEEGEIKTVWKSEVIAGSPLAMLGSLPDSLKAEIRRIIVEEANIDALVASGICASVDECGLTDEKIWGYVERDDSFYDGVRKVCEVTGSSKCE